MFTVFCIGVVGVAAGVVIVIFVAGTTVVVAAVPPSLFIIHWTLLSVEIHIC